MHIIVLVKQVPDTSEVKINRETNTLIRDGVPSTMICMQSKRLSGSVKNTEGK